MSHIGDESLFDALVKDVKFEEWGVLTALGGGYHMQLYKYHGPDWFDSDPDLCRQGAREAVDLLQAGFPLPTAAHKDQRVSC
jgi:hypothetical protein